MSTNYTPYGNRVLLKLQKTELSAGGIHLPFGDNNVNRGEVLKVGTGGKDAKGNPLPMDVAVGDVVLFDQGNGEYLDPDTIILDVKHIQGVFA